MLSSPLHKTLSLTMPLLLVGAMLGARQVSAAQEITLRSGAVIVGKVQMDGDAVSIQIDDSSLRVAFKEIATITPLDQPTGDQAQRLLISAFENRLLNGADSSGLGLLAEAYRLEPENPRVAFWYARILADSNNGTAAKVVLDKHQKAITAAYPGLSEQLAKRIESRLELEKLPPALVRRIDSINAQEPNLVAGSSDRIAKYVYFRLLDDRQEPIGQSKFRMDSHGSKELLLSFDQGYYLYSYSMSPNSNYSDDDCTLKTNDAALKPEEFKFSGEYGRITNAGKFVAHRFQESDKVPVEITVVDPESQPVANAQVSLRSSGGLGSATQTVATDANGRATFMVFPAAHSLSVSAADYKTELQPLKINVDSSERVKQKVELHYGVTATIRVAWQSDSQQDGAEHISGESTLKIKSGQYVRDNQTLPWIHLQQVGGGLSLLIPNPQYGYPRNNLANDWVRVIKRSAEEEDENTETINLPNYGEIDTADLEKYREEFPKPPVPPAMSRMNRGVLPIKVEPNGTYVGQILQRSRDGRNRPTTISFKIHVESLNAGPKQE